MAIIEDRRRTDDQEAPAHVCEPQYEYDDADRWSRDDEEEGLGQAVPTHDDDVPAHHHDDDDDRDVCRSRSMPRMES
jgi:hypothetical protein